MSNVGFVKLFRTLLEWEWYDNVNVRLTFIHCILKANYKDKRWQGRVIKRGSFVSSYTKLASEIGISYQQVRTAIEKLLKTGEIGVESQTNNTLYTIINYDDYQQVTRGIIANDNERVTDKQRTDNEVVTNEQRTDNERITTTKERKKERSKEEKKKKELIVKFLEVANFFQSETGKKLDIPATDSGILKYSHFEKVSARIKEGATVEDCKAVIRVKTKEWKGTRNEKYLRPATLFNREKFTSYMEEVLNENPIIEKSSIHEQFDFVSPRQREAYFFARLETYRPHLNPQKYSSEYHPRAFGSKREVEKLVHELEAQFPELLKIEFVGDSWQDIR